MNRRDYAKLKREWNKLVDDFVTDAVKRDASWIQIRLLIGGEEEGEDAMDERVNAIIDRVEKRKDKDHED